jgi:hypothetical protein
MYDLSMEMIHEDNIETVYQSTQNNTLSHWIWLHELITTKHQNKEYRTLTVGSSLFISFLN